MTTGAKAVWCEHCGRSPRWGSDPFCYGCLLDGIPPCEVVPVLAVHYDLSVAMAEVRRKRALWEAKHPAWELVPDYQRVVEDSAAPSKYVDRDTSIGRKRVWARFKVEARHPKGRRHG